VVKELGLPFSTPDPQSWGIPSIGGATFNLGLSPFGNDSNGPFLLNDKIAQLVDSFSGSVATSNLPLGDGPARVAVRISAGQLEHVVDELILNAEYRSRSPIEPAPSA
jgi:hypothetical protein